MAGCPCPPYPRMAELLGAPPTGATGGIPSANSGARAPPDEGRGRRSGRETRREGLCWTGGGCSAARGHPRTVVLQEIRMDAQPRSVSPALAVAGPVAGLRAGKEPSSP